MIEVPKGWEVTQLGKVGSFKNGVNKSKDDFGFGVPFINLQDVFGHWEIKYSDFDLVNATNEEVKNYDLKKGDVLFIRSSVKPSGVGLTSIVKEDIHNTIYSGFIIRFRSKDKIFDVNYKKYCFHDEFFRQRLLQKSTVSANSNINQESLVSLGLLLPPKKEQEKIAKILSTLDNAIESTNRIIEKEKNIKTALMQELLTNGIDKNGQIRTPQTHTYKPSELGLIPDEWEVISLKKVLNLLTDYHANGSYENLKENIELLEQDDYAIMIRTTNFEQNNFNSNLIYVNKHAYNYLKKSKVHEDDIIINKIANAGATYLMPKIDKPVTLAMNLFLLKLSDKVENKFIYFQIKLREKSLKILASGTSTVTITKKDVEDFKVFFPPIEEQKQIAKILTTQDKKIEKEKENLVKLKELKKGLMNDLLSGEVRVKV